MVNPEGSPGGDGQPKIWTAHNASQVILAVDIQEKQNGPGIWEVDFFGDFGRVTSPETEK